MSRRSGVPGVFILIGLTASVAQVVLLRELLVVFSGNETSIGLMLAAWLVWTAAGSGCANRISVSWNPRLLTAGIQVLLSLLLPLTVVAVRSAKGLLQSVPGEILGPAAMLSTSLLAQAPLCLLTGALFTIGTRLCPEQSVPGATGTVYAWEAVGSAAGGLLAGCLLTGCLLFRSLGSLEIACLVGLANLAAASALTAPRKPLRYAAPASVAAVAALLAWSGIPRTWELATEKRFWCGQSFIAARDSVFGRIVLTGTGEGRSIYENGVVVANFPDPAAAEEAVHYALLEHPDPRSVLLIGGGLNGGIAEALRHPSIECLDYVELDPALLQLSREYFQAQWIGVERTSRVRLHAVDGRRFLKTARAAYDVIIINVPGPHNAQLNRFYTVEFFREAAQRISPGGLLSLRLESSENYISDDVAQFLRSIHKSLLLVFPAVTFLPGETVRFFASSTPGFLFPDAAGLVARLHARHLETSYVSEYLIPFRMAADRTAELSRRIRPLPDTPLNSDFAPIAYFFDVTIWSGQFHPGYRRIFHALAGIRFGSLAAAVAILSVVLFATLGLVTRPETRPRFAAASCTAAAGFTMMSLEVLLLLGFQSVHGYVYQQLAVLIAAFMAGMGLGCYAALRRPAGGTGLLAATQLLTAAAPLLLVQTFPVANAIAFPAMALLCGVLGGFEFPIASRIFFPGTDHGAGTLYALDLAGSSLGVVLLSAWLLPVFGFFRTSLLLALVSLGPALLAVLAPRESAGAESATPLPFARQTPAR